MLERLTRTLIGPTGIRVEIPLLNVRLLEALAAVSPQFVSAELLLAQVWPDTHIGADVLKQRVRLVRRSLEEAGYDSALLDSVRGEGYALRATLAAPVDSAPVHPAQGISTAPRRRIAWLALVSLCVVAAATAIVLRLARTPDADQPTIGNMPVRVGVAAAPGDRTAALVLDGLRRIPHTLLVPASLAPNAPVGAECADSAEMHLCLSVMPAPGATARVTLSLSQRRTGAVLLREQITVPVDSAGLHASLQRAALFMTPEVLRWLGGSGRGDFAFTQYREAVLALEAPDCSRRAMIIEGLRAAITRSPNFAPAQQMLARYQALGADCIAPSR